MASNPPANTGKTEKRRDAEQDMLMREVDEAVRQDQVSTVAKKYGIAIAVALVVILAAFGGWLFWQDRQETALAERSEGLVMAIDELQAGNTDVADEELAALIEDAGPGVATSARLLRAGIAVDDGRTDEGVAMYEEVAGDGDAPEAYRDYAAIRAVTLQFDELEPDDIIARLGPLANAGNPWFGSAGELVAMAYIRQGEDEQAGQLLAAIAQDETVPETLRARTRQLAGLLGYDAIEDVDETLAEVGQAGASQPLQAPNAE